MVLNLPAVNAPRTVSGVVSSCRPQSVERQRAGVGSGERGKPFKAAYAAPLLIIPSGSLDADALPADIPCNLGDEVAGRVIDVQRE